MPFSESGRAPDEFSPAEVHTVHAGVRLRRHGTAQARLCGGGEGALPVLQLRGLHADSVRGGRVFRIGPIPRVEKSARFPNNNLENQYPPPWPGKCRTL